MPYEILWNVSANKVFESGLDRPVLYLRDVNGEYPAGVPWEGLMSLSEKPGGAEITDMWANNAKYASLVSPEIFDGSIEAYTYPDEFNACNGVIEAADGVFAGQQGRSVFGLSYRTWVGSDAAGQYGSYKLHLIYGCLVQPSEVARATINDSPEALTFSWEFKTTPIPMTGFMNISKLTLDSSLLLPADLLAIEEQLYGETSGTPVTANLPLPDEILALLTP
jgi:hypothetical protein